MDTTTKSEKTSEAVQKVVAPFAKEIGVIFKTIEEATGTQKKVREDNAGRVMKAYGNAYAAVSAGKLDLKNRQVQSAFRAAIKGSGASTAKMRRITENVKNSLHSQLAIQGFSAWLTNDGQRKPEEVVDYLADRGIKTEAALARYLRNDEPPALSLMERLKKWDEEDLEMLRPRILELFQTKLS
jgi:hypothetical protein